MRLALVGWANDSGLGREFFDAVNHLPVEAAFVLQNAGKPTRRDLLEKVKHHLASKPQAPTEMEKFIETYKPDTILTWEIPGGWEYPGIWKRHGIRWVHVVHWDWFAPQHMALWKEADLVAPNAMCQRELEKNYGLKAALLPVPIDTDLFKFRLRERAETFISVYGYGGAENRRGLPQIFMAWKTFMGKPPLVFRAQQKPYETNMPFGVGFQIGSTPDPAGLFVTGDVAVQFSRFEGVGVTLLEAQACGLPVIAVDAEPMNELAPDLLVPVDRVEHPVIYGKRLPSYVGSSAALTRTVLRLYRTDITELSNLARARVEKNYSWMALKQQWISLLSGA